MCSTRAARAQPLSGARIAWCGAWRARAAPERLALMVPTNP
eukprot:CAMPEP_0119409612 /NCGR_PEP_ID=MMETSP1335-20130426/2863_1 /TAXON_ID=259385 /ORGANISM="Chrysoculter rhomboideus, Strain RCC1486" /LENGTH=40 /DNA_ID= /DNA_START= /DNA_END= /DNA_ORIENTATION=